jgi:hypothetical protein
MTTHANLVLTDRAGTPVNHTFTPDGKPNGIVTWVESNGVKVGDKTFTVGWRTSASRRRVSLRLVVPVVADQTINGISSPSVIRTAYANVDFNFDVRSTKQERDDIVGMLATAIAKATTQVDKAIVDLERIS